MIYKEGLMKQEISSFWYTPRGYKGIGLMELLSIKSFIDNGYKFILYTYNLDDKIFKKRLVIILDTIYFILKKKGGGVWVDLDMICLNYIDLNEEYIFTQEVDEDNKKSRITTSFLKFSRYSDFGKNLIQEAEKIINKRKKISWGVIGPWFLADHVKKCGLENFVWDYKRTCQIPWCNVKIFLDNTSIDISQPFLHLFSEMWRLNNMEKNTFHQMGVYGQLLKKHEIEKLYNQINTCLKTSMLDNIASFLTKFFIKKL